MSSSPQLRVVCACTSLPVLLKFAGWPTVCSKGASLACQPATTPNFIVYDELEYCTVSFYLQHVAQLATFFVKINCTVLLPWELTLHLLYVSRFPRNHRTLSNLAHLRNFPTPSITTTVYSTSLWTTSLAAENPWSATTLSTTLLSIPKKTTSIHHLVTNVRCPQAHMRLIIPLCLISS